MLGPIKLPRGGARNFANRQSWQLRERDCRKLIDASLAALAAEMPFNRFVTIAWALGGVPADQAVDATCQFRRLAKAWMRARGTAMPWAWVQEYGNTFGQHAHILLHVPPHLDPLFRSMPLRWTKAILPGRYVARTLQTQRLKNAAAFHGRAYQTELLGKVHYMLKAAPIELEVVLDMAGRGRKDWGQFCPVIGKRVGVWQDWKKAAHGRF